VTPVWIDPDGDFVLVNAALENVKQRNATKGKLVLIADQNNTYDRVTIQGRVADHTREGTDPHIDKRANKYTGAKK
jgi:hypothetical protein